MLSNIEGKNHGELRFQGKFLFVGWGLFPEVLSISQTNGKVCFSGIIGHVRYSTFGKSTIQNAQPLKVKDLCVAHNGTIANVEELAGMVGGCSFTPQTMSDTLIAAQRLVSLNGRGQRS